MGKGRFLNQKMGKRQSHRDTLLKAVLTSGQRHPQLSPKDSANLTRRLARNSAS